MAIGQAIQGPEILDENCRVCSGSRKETLDGKNKKRGKEQVGTNQNDEGRYSKRPQRVKENGRGGHGICFTSSFALFCLFYTAFYLVDGRASIP